VLCARFSSAKKKLSKIFSRKGWLSPVEEGGGPGSGLGVGHSPVEGEGRRLGLGLGLGLGFSGLGSPPGGGEVEPWRDSLATFRRRVARNPSPRPGPTSVFDFDLPLSLTRGLSTTNAKKPTPKGRLLWKKCAAVSYSPARPPSQYHRR
jgi:hypothetical protein